jgi:2-acylglycerol O-acyltransferase 2
MSATQLPAVEPADPQVREAEGLPPKSYAAAAEEAIHDSAPADSLDSKNFRLRGANGTKGTGGTYGSYDANGIRHGKKKNVENINTNGIPISPPASSDNEYEGQGLDSSPKSPTRGHKRKVSHKTSGSLGRSAGKKASHEVFEDYQGANGKPLTSVKPPADLENKTVDQSHQPRERNALTAGRKAGAGWQQSKYVDHALLDRLSPPQGWFMGDGFFSVEKGLVSSPVPAKR